MSGKKEAVSRIPERQESLRVPFVSQIPDPEAEVGAVKIRTRVLTNIGSRIHFITGKMEERLRV
jgi:hypothetical protein